MSFIVKYSWKRENEWLKKKFIVWALKEKKRLIEPNYKKLSIRRLLWAFESEYGEPLLWTNKGVRGDITNNEPYWWNFYCWIPFYGSRKILEALKL